MDLEKSLIKELYKDYEIIRRLIEATDPLSGPTSYAVDLYYCAPNDVEPPIIKLSIFDRDFQDDCVFSATVDQNTTFGDFVQMLDELRDVTHICLEARKHNISYKDERANQQGRLSRKVKSGDLPF